MKKIILGVASLCCMSLLAMAQTDEKYSWMKLTQTDPFTTHTLDKNGQIQEYTGTDLHTGMLCSSVNINCPDIPDTAEKLTDVSERVSYTDMYGRVACDTTRDNALEVLNRSLSFMSRYKTELTNTFSIYRGGQYTFRNTLPGIGYDYSKVVDILDEPSVRIKGSSVKVGEDINVEAVFNTGYPYDASQFTGNEKAKLTLYYNPVGVEELTEIASTEKQLSLCRTDQPLIAAVDTVRMKLEKPAVGRYVVRISSDWNFDEANTQVFLTVRDTVVTCTIGSTEYASIQDAISDINEKDTIKVVKDIALKSTITVPADAPAFILDLNGHVLSGDSIPTPTGAGELGNIIQNLGNLTIIDSDSLAMHTDTLSTMTGGILTGGKGGYNFYGYDAAGKAQYWTKPVGGAIFNRGKLTMKGGTVYKNTAKSGAGITNDIDGEATLKGCTVCGNYSSNFCGGVLAFDGYVKLEDCTVNNNSARYGAGVSNAYGKTDMTNCYIFANTAKYGGGVYNESGKMTMTDCNIHDNTGTVNAGGVCIFAGKTSMQKCIVHGNFSKEGAGIYVESDTLLMVGCDVNENSSSNRGGGIYIQDGYVNLKECNLNDNSYKYGGGIYMINGIADMSDCHFDINKDGDLGGGVYVFYGTANMTNCTVVGNIVNYYGGGIRVEQGTLNMTGCTVNCNSAPQGGGMSNITGTVTMKSCEFVSNSASKDGGAMECAGKETLEDCTITDNTCADLPSGGINLWPMDSTSFMVLKGKVVIKDNTTNGQATNLCCYVHDTYKAQVTLDSLAEGSEIGVSAEMDSVAGSTYQFSTNGTADDVKYFSADEKGYLVQYNAAGYLELLAASTGIDTVSAVASEDAPVYDLQGRRMTKDSIAKGIYIKDSKKVFIK